MSAYDSDGPRDGNPVEFKIAGVWFSVSGTRVIACSTGRTRYLVRCLTCNETLHDATTGPTPRIRHHMEDQHGFAGALEHRQADSAPPPAGGGPYRTAGRPREQRPPRNPGASWKTCELGRSDSCPDTFEGPATPDCVDCDGYVPLRTVYIEVERSADLQAPLRGDAPRPWRAYTDVAGGFSVGGPRAKTPWAAIGSLYEALDRKCDEAEAGPRVNGHIQVARPQDGRYIPSPSVDSSKQEREAMETAKTRKAVDHLVSLVQAILSADPLPDEGRREPLEEALKVYLAARERDDLGLPWHARVMPTAPEHGKRYWRVVDYNDRTIAESLTEGQAKLMAQAGAMAEKLEDWLTDEDYLESVEVEALLARAGWQR
jgi:hypothetical protein